MTPLRSALVLGGGSAGLLAALTLRRRLPQVAVRLVRSPDLGIIGVGEGTTPAFPKHLHEFLGLRAADFFREAEPTFKLGVHFLWGPRPAFNYTFTLQLDARLRDLPKANGYYCDDDFPATDTVAALMQHDKVFPAGPNGLPQPHTSVAYHIENAKLVGYLENRARESGVEITDGTVTSVEPGTEGVAAVVLESGERCAADLFVDATGFRAELIGRAMGERWHDWSGSLFCDRAVIGGWARSDEPIHPYTTAETMSAGWCWQIEHEHFINRGYVFGSRFLEDEAARAELLAANPKLDPAKTRVVKFRSGRHDRAWVGNVLAVGNAYGFVEPLEASALMALSVQLRSFVDAIADSDLTPSDALRALYNRITAAAWDDLRDFLALHYRCNTRLDTPFWRACRTDTDLAGAAPVLDYYRVHGPSLLAKQVLVTPHSLFGYEGYLVQLVGNRVPYAQRHAAAPAEMKAWARHLDRCRDPLPGAYSVAQALAAMRSPAWRWP